MDYLKYLPGDFYVDADDARASLANPETFAGFQAMNELEVFKIDNFIANDDWQRECLTRAIPLEILPGSPIPFSSAEDIIVAKCRWFNLGNRVSDRQWNDLIRLYEVQHGRLDVGYIVRWLRASICSTSGRRCNGMRGREPVIGSTSAFRSRRIGSL